jgi:hypothetical protein
MKRSLIILGLLVVLSLGAANAETSAFYPVRVNVVKVFSHSQGYEIIYRKGIADTAAAFVPIKWFVPGGKAELVQANDAAYPYMVVFYKDGKFDHLRLYVKSDLKDSSWGTLDPKAGEGKFSSEDIKLEF